MKTFLEDFYTGWGKTKFTYCLNLIAWFPLFNIHISVYLRNILNMFSWIFRYTFYLDMYRYNYEVDNYDRLIKK
jgi:hypothetical protein